MLDIVVADAWWRAAVNLSGMAALVATAYVVSWFKRQPWRMPGRAATVAPMSGARAEAAPR